MKNKILITFLFLMVTLLFVNAESDNFTHNFNEAGFSPGNSYLFSKYGININNYTGDLYYTQNLVSLPGRAGLDLDVTINYSGSYTHYRVVYGKSGREVSYSNFPEWFFTVNGIPIFFLNFDEFDFENSSVQYANDLRWSIDGFSELFLTEAIPRQNVYSNYVQSYNCGGAGKLNFVNISMGLNGTVRLRPKNNPNWDDFSFSEEVYDYESLDKDNPLRGKLYSNSIPANLPDGVTLDPGFYFELMRPDGSRIIYEIRRTQIPRSTRHKAVVPHLIIDKHQNFIKIDYTYTPGDHRFWFNKIEITDSAGRLVTIRRQPYWVGDYFEVISPGTNGDKKHKIYYSKVFQGTSPDFNESPYCFYVNKIVEPKTILQTDFYYEEYPQKSFYYDIYQLCKAPMRARIKKIRTPLRKTLEFTYHVDEWTKIQEAIDDGEVNEADRESMLETMYTNKFFYKKSSRSPHHTNMIHSYVEHSPVEGVNIHSYKYDWSQDTTGNSWKLNEEGVKYRTYIKNTYFTLGVILDFTPVEYDIEQIIKSKKDGPSWDFPIQEHKFVYKKCLLQEYPTKQWTNKLWKEYTPLPMKIKQDWDERIIDGKKVQVLMKKEFIYLDETSYPEEEVVIGMYTEEYNYDEYMNLIKKKDPNGVETFMTYEYRDTNNYFIINKPKFIERRFDNQLLEKTEFVYYKDALVKGSFYNISKLRMYYDAGNFYRIKYDYDAYGNLIQREDQESNITMYEYDPQSNSLMTKIKREYERYNNNGVIINNNAIFQVEANYYPDGTIKEIIKPNNTKVRYQYDNVGRLTKVENIDLLSGGTIYPSFQYEYDDNLIEVTVYQITAPDEIIKKNKYKYYSSGKLLSSIVYDRDSEGNVVEYKSLKGYYAYGKIRFETDPENKTTIYYYDNQAFRLIKTAFVHYEGSFGRDPEVTGELNYKYKVINQDGKIRNLTYIYDENHPVGDEEDPGPWSKSTKYDESGNLIKVTEINGTYGKYVYDKLNRLIRVNAPNNITFKKSYDMLGRMVTATNPTGNITTFEYYRNNLVKKVTEPTGVYSKFIYDGLDRVIFTKNEDGTDPGTVTFFSKYNNVGNKVYETNKLSTDVVSPEEIYQNYYYYDNLNRLKRYRNLYKNNTFTSDITYKTDGNVEKKEYNYFCNGIETAKTLYYDYYFCDRLKGISDNPDNPALNPIESYTYSDKGMLLEKQLHLPTKEIKTGFVYDKRDRLKILGVYIDPVSYDSLYDFFDENYYYGGQYSYDKVGNLMKQNENGAVTIYSYDDLYRLLKVYGPDYRLGGHQYSYDSCGNRLKFVYETGIINYSYDKDMLQRFVDGDKEKSFDYDQSGKINMIYEYFKGKNTVKNFYSYNLQNRVKEVRTFSALTSDDPISSVRFFYNGAGNRTRKVSEKEDRIYIRDAGGGTVFEAVKDDSDNYNISDYYFYGKGLTYKEKFETDGTSKKEYYFYDRLGNVVLLLDEDANVLERNKLDPFGNTIMRTSKTDNKRLFIGKERDYETGLDYFEARYMANDLGRFISPDLASPSLTDTQSFNRYVYCRNNPMKYVDLDGNDIYEAKVSEEKSVSRNAFYIRDKIKELQKSEFWEVYMKRFKESDKKDIIYYITSETGYIGKKQYLTEKHGGAEGTKGNTSYVYLRAKASGFEKTTTIGEIVHELLHSLAGLTNIRKEVYNNDKDIEETCVALKVLELNELGSIPELSKDEIKEQLYNVGLYLPNLKNKDNELYEYANKKVSEYKKKYKIE